MADNLDDFYEFIKETPRRVHPTGSYRSGNQGEVQQKNYSAGLDIDLPGNLGIGGTMYGYDVKSPEFRAHGKGVADLRAKYMTDDGIVYAAGRNPESKAWRLSRSNPKSESTLSLERSPANNTTWVNYQKNFAKGGEVDYDELYDFRTEPEDKGYADGGLVYNDYDEMFEFR